LVLVAGTQTQSERGRIGSHPGYQNRSFKSVYPSSRYNGSAPLFGGSLTLAEIAIPPTVH